MNRIQYLPWSIKSEQPMNTDKKFFESIFSQGNGYMGLRGTLPEDTENKSYERCAFIAGVFDYMKAGITDMVNTPDYMITRISVDGELFSPLSTVASDFSQELCMKDGTLVREMLWTTSRGQLVKIRSNRFLSLADVHTSAIRYELTPVNFSGELLFETGIDYDITNQPIADDQMKQNEDVIRMITPLTVEAEADRPLLLVKTSSTAEIHIAYSFSLKSPKEKKVAGQKTVGEKIGEQRTGEQRTEGQRTEEQNGYVGKSVRLSAEMGKTLVFDKLVSVFTSRECNKEDLLQQVSRHAKQNECLGFEQLLQNTKGEWAKRWETADIEIIGNDQDQSALRYNLFQLIQTNSAEDCTVNIGARGIMHGRYKGCYFWDTDVFMLPFYIGTNPQAARNLVKYRYLMLEDARKNAEKMNLRGARYPWMCSIDGKEQCESWDIGSSEVHVTADVAYAIDHYCKETGDSEFLQQYAIEVYLETARYWASRLTYDEAEEVYNLLFVKGPDEYCGITSNNTYTNWLIRHNLKLALQGIDFLKSNAPDQFNQLKQRIALKESEPEEWKTILQKLKLPYRKEKALYLQDETFEKLEPIDISAYKTEGIPLYRTICFDRLQRYRVLKQADLLLLMIMLPEDFTKQQKLAAWNYYEPLTLHDSSLSYGVHSILAADLGDAKKAEEYFLQSLYLDIENRMDNTGVEGLHFAAFGITWQAVVHGFAGLKEKDGELCAEPKLPSSWDQLSFSYQYHGKQYKIHMTKDSVEIKEAE